MRDTIGSQLRRYSEAGVDVTWLTVPRVGDHARFMAEHLTLTLTLTLTVIAPGLWLST